jgi:bifunctional UDP-N-acetylglucosamine pyrophosphorylase/glucosamine-1-phosphate N-acetyltransferase
MAHAVLAAREAIMRGADLLVVFGDTPLISAQTFQRLRAPLRNGAALALVVFPCHRPDRLWPASARGRLLPIREHADATAAERDTSAGQQTNREGGALRKLSLPLNPVAIGHNY